LPIDLRKFGYKNEGSANNGWKASWILILTDVHWETFKKVFGAENIEIKLFRYFRKKELMKNYAVMLDELY